jgi:hypothetical protein
MRELELRVEDHQIIVNLIDSRYSKRTFVFIPILCDSAGHWGSSVLAPNYPCGPIREA